MAAPPCVYDIATEPFPFESAIATARLHTVLIATGLIRLVYARYDVFCNVC